MPVAGDRFPPTCRGSRPPVTQGPPTTTAVSFVSPPEFLPDLQADSAMEDETDGLSFVSMDLAAAAVEGIHPTASFNRQSLEGSRTFGRGIPSSEQFGLSNNPGIHTGYNYGTHTVSSNLTNELERLSIRDHFINESSTNGMDTLVPRSMPRFNESHTRHWLSDVNPQTVDLPTQRQGLVPYESSVTIRSPPELPNEDDIYSDTKNCTTNRCVNTYSLWFEIDSDGDTPLLLAIIHQVTEQALHMIRSCPSADLLDHRNLLQQSALHLAVLTHQPVLVRALVVAGAPLDTRDRRGNTALHLCCKQGDVDSAAALTSTTHSIERGPLYYSIPPRQIPQEMSIMNYDGETCLHVAARCGHLAMVEYLLSSKHIRADPNVADGKSGRTILHYAVESRDVPLVLFLMARSDVKIDSRTFDGTTALGLALGRQFMDIANLLLSAGANVDFVHASDSDSDCDCALMEDES